MPKPKRSQEIEEKIIAKVLGVMLPLGIVTVIAGGIIPAFMPGLRTRIIPDIAVAAFLALVWLASERGKVRLAAHLLTAILSIAILVGMAVNGGVLSQSYRASLLLIALTAWLYGPRVAVGFAIACVAVGGAFVGLDALGLLPEAQLFSPLFVWTMISITCLLMLGATAIPNHMLRQAFDESEESRAEAEEAHRYEKQALEALQESEERYRDLIENSQDLISTHDLEGRMLSANEASARASGYPVKSILGMNLVDLLDPTTRDQFDAYLNTMRTQGQASGIVTIRTASGETRYWEYRNTLRTEGVDVPIVRGMAHDITERKLAEAERKKLEAQLRQAQKMESVGLLAGGVAHEFNNLLQGIMGYVEILQMDLGTDSSHGRKLEKVYQAGKRAADLTHQLLAFSRRQTLFPVCMDLNPLIQDLMKLLKPIIGANIDLRFIPAAGLGTVYADKRQIEVVLMNLCINARDVMPQGGQLIIETENVDIGEAYCREHESTLRGRYAMIRITDTGHGMDDATRAHIFDPFFTTKGVGEGTGLGLAMVYGIVKQHTGMIDIYSEINKGTSFEIYLPIVDEPAAEDASSGRVLGPGGTETILIAEDEDIVLLYLEQILSRGGYTVLSACDGEEALRIFEEHADAIDLALLDVMMPKLGGHDVMDHIQAVSPRVRFLFSSGYSENPIQTNFIIKEGLRLIKKPYEAANLLRAVRETLDGSHESA